MYHHLGRNASKLELQYQENLQREIQERMEKAAKSKALRTKRMAKRAKSAKPFFEKPKINTNMLFINIDESGQGANFEQGMETIIVHDQSQQLLPNSSNMVFMNTSKDLSIEVIGSTKDDNSKDDSIDIVIDNLKSKDDNDLSKMEYSQIEAGSKTEQVSLVIDNAKMDDTDIQAINDEEKEETKTQCIDKVIASEE